MHFDKVHQHFFEKLKQSCSDLTEENLKMCAYFKIGMTTKQIAHLLHVDPHSVIVSRYRLKKKLQLPDGESLDDFIRNL
jgi:DNA-binding NarL/FixJ family response regulator